MESYYKFVLSKKYKKHVEFIRKKGILPITILGEDEHSLYLELPYQEDADEMRRLKEAIFANCNM